MANSQYEYVRHFETHARVPLSTWPVVRLDGRAFTKLTAKYAFEKPNDRRALDLMNACAVEVLRAIPDIVLAYGQSDEFSFVFGEGTRMFERREAKLVSTVVSLFTAEYCMQWPQYMTGIALERPWPQFDGRAVSYPKKKVLRDYLAWRQADCHVNNLYNTTFWALVLRGGMSGTEAEERLKGTLAGDKNEILFAGFGVNYNREEEVFRKGTVVYRDFGGEEGKGAGEDGEGRGGGAGGEEMRSKTQIEKEKKRKRKARIAVEHVDIIGNGFWDARPWILGGGEE